MGVWVRRHGLRIRRRTGQYQERLRDGSKTRIKDKHTDRERKG